MATTPKKTTLRNYAMESSIEDAVQTVYDELESLRDEVNDALDNQRDHPGIAATERFARLEEAGGNLDSICDERPEWCVSIQSELSATMRCSYTVDMRKSASRGDRANNAVAMFDAAASALREWADEQRALHGRIEDADGEPLTEAENEAVAGRDAETIGTQADEADELAGILEEHQATAEGLEFS